jgi:Alpha/beta hydrolase domain
MKAPVRRIFAAVPALIAIVLPVVIRAEVARVEISRRQDVLGGNAFGTVGAYEKLVGKVYYAVAPENPHNRIIADLDKAPRDSQGKVEFSADVFILRPKDAARGNGVLLFDLVNRGRMTLLNIFNHGAASADPATEAEFGDGFLMRQGYTLVSIGWQFDVPKRDGLIGFDPPVATDHGQPITGWVNPWFIPNKRSESFEYASGYFSPAYPPMEPQDPAYRLTEREGWVAAPRLIPRADWQFGRVEKGQVIYDSNWVSLKGGFKAGMTYQITYEAKNPPIAGLGFAAIRDLAASLKHDPAAVAPGRYAYTYGASQTGRYQRHLIYDGFTTDEQGRQAIDALFIQTGGTGLGSFNERFAQPDELGSFTQTKFPIRYETTTDPVTGKRDGLGARVPAGQEPKVFLIDTGSEYWDRGRVAALRHLSMDGTEDLSDPSNMRVFLFSGTQHGPGTWPPRDNGGQLKSNPNDYRWLESALLADLDRWVREGVAPPPSRHPTLADATLVAQSKIEFPKVPGVQWPYHVPGGYRIDLPGPLSALPFLVPRVDSDGNDIGGLRTPELAVPLGTYTDWDFRSESIGSPDTLIAMAGSFIPFAKTRAEREKNGDPRLSLEERYPNRADYLRRVQEAANRLVAERFVLAEHVKTIIEEAGQHWDWMMAQTTASAQR